MIISSTPHETRVAILEDDQVVEIFIEREHSRGVVGNIYKGRVSKVLPGMQSAFVDLGLERDAFLYVTDVISPTEEALEDDEEIVTVPVPEPSPAAPLTDGVSAAGTANFELQTSNSELLAPVFEESPENGETGDLHPDAPEPAGGGVDGVALAAAATPAIGSPIVVDVAAPANGAPANGAPSNGGPRGGRNDRRGGRPERQPSTAKIEDLLKEREEIVVQVVKEPLGTKGARITSHLSLPGRFLVYMPTVDHIGVSRKIESRDERRRLRTIVQKFREA
jgi:ribonuclease G